jgi:predicted lysophospholipase L1 biosynthesis ABC-type transport system permease subunit
MPVLLLRVLYTIFAATSFALFVVYGNASIIASTVFLCLIMFFNIVMIIHHCVSLVLKVTVELRQSGWKQSLGTKSKPKVATFLDIGLSLCLFICLVVGHVLHRPLWNRWRNPRNVWEVGFAFGCVCL